VFDIGMSSLYPYVGLVRESSEVLLRP